MKIKCFYEEIRPKINYSHFLRKWFPSLWVYEVIYMHIETVVNATLKTHLNKQFLLKIIILFLCTWMKSLHTFEYETILGIMCSTC